MSDQINEFIRRLEEAKTPEERKIFALGQIKVTELLDYDDFVDESWFYDPAKHGGMPELGYAALKLAGEGGEAAEKVGKAYRDNGGKLEDVPSFLKELGDILFYVVKLAHLNGATLDDVVKLNMAKLRDRAARGKMRGSGDNR